jgi:hypothetical protein
MPAGPPITLPQATMAKRGTAMDNSRNPTYARPRLWRHALAGSLAAMLIMGGIGHALAQDDDDELPDSKFFKGILSGLGLKKDGEQSGIAYQERPPLVVPPTRDLPPPQSADAVRGNALWPQDQDEKRRREAAAKRRKESQTFNWEDLGRQMSPNELRKGAATAKDEALSRRSASGPEAYNQQSTPSQLGYVGGLFGSVSDFFGGNKTETATFEAEPPRGSLTDPPTGYRSPSPAEPYGVGPDKGRSKAMKAEDLPSSGGDTPTK